MPMKISYPVLFNSLRRFAFGPRDSAF